MYRLLKNRLDAVVLPFSSAFGIFMRLTEHRPLRSLRTFFVPCGDGSVALRRLPTGDMLLDLFMGIDCPEDDV